MKKRVLLTDIIQPVGMEVLKKSVEVVLAADPSAETISNMIQDFDGLISRNTIIDEYIFSKAKRLKVVASHGVGTDHIDVDAATKHNVLVVNTPGANAESVAEMVVGMMIALSRKIVAGDIALRVNKDFYYRNNCIGSDLFKKTIGIFGMGQIGQRLARICSMGFSMKVLGYDPYVSAKKMLEMNVTKVNKIEDLVSNSDYISLNCPYFEELHKMVNEDFLKLMKPSAFLINCARGQLIDEQALYNALKNKTIAGAALDVLYEEPPKPDNPLFTLPNVITTPHIAAYAKDSIDNMSLISALDVLHVLNGNAEKAHVVNKELLTSL